jgi:hypothetical protein
MPKAKQGLKKSSRKAKRKVGTGPESTPAGDTAPAKRGVVKKSGTKRTRRASDSGEESPATRARSSTDVGPAPDITPRKPIKPTRTKRQRRETTVSESDAERYRVNAEANKAALEDIYHAFYRGGQRRDRLDRLDDDLYNIMGEGPAGYLRVGISDEDFRAFNVTDGDIEVAGQKVDAYNDDVAAYKKDFAAYEKDDARYKTRLEEWRRTGRKGRRPLAPRAPTAPTGPSSNGESVVKGDYFHVLNKHYDKSQDRTGRARRIIVNVKTQKAARSRVGPGIAWAEEPDAYIKNMKGISFTESRSKVIADAIRANSDVASKDQFIKLVNDALKSARVDPVSPHRHLETIT